MEENLTTTTATTATTGTETNPDAGNYYVDMQPDITYVKMSAAQSENWDERKSQILMQCMYAYY